MAAFVDVRGVQVLHWNPRRSFTGLPVLRRIRLGPTVDNFGDLLGPMIVSSLAARLPTAQVSSTLLSVGSIMHFASDGNVIWGAGVNGKITAEAHRFTRLDVRAVRGPRTREFLQHRGIKVPRIFGDPALLLPVVRRDLREFVGTGTSGVVIIPNLNDVVEPGVIEAHGITHLDPRSPIEHCLRTIVSAERVITSSLHGLVIAEAFGVPVTLVRSKSEPIFKFDDYVLGTGRTMDGLHSVVSFEDGLAERPKTTPLEWDPRPLRDAFPADLWESNEVDSRSSS